MLQGAHVVQPVGELDHDHPGILRHRQEELPVVLHLALGQRAELDPGDLREPVHDAWRSRSRTPGGSPPPTCPLSSTTSCRREAAMDTVSRWIPLEDLGDLDAVGDVVLPRSRFWPACFSLAYWKASARSSRSRRSSLPCMARRKSGGSSAAGPWGASAAPVPDVTLCSVASGMVSPAGGSPRDVRQLHGTHEATRGASSETAASGRWADGGIPLRLRLRSEGRPRRPGTSPVSDGVEGEVVRPVAPVTMRGEAHGSDDQGMAHGGEAEGAAGGPAGRGAVGPGAPGAPAGIGSARPFGSRPGRGPARGVRGLPAAPRVGRAGRAGDGPGCGAGPRRSGRGGLRAGAPGGGGAGTERAPHPRDRPTCTGDWGRA